MLFPNSATVFFFIRTKHSLSSFRHHKFRVSLSPQGQNGQFFEHRGNPSGAGPVYVPPPPLTSPLPYSPVLLLEISKATSASAPLRLRRVRRSRFWPPPGEMAGLGKAMYAVGFWIRETGQALDRLGCRLQGKYFFHEQSKCRCSSAPPRLFPNHPLVSFDSPKHSARGGGFVWPERPERSGVIESGLLDRVRSG